MAKNHRIVLKLILGAATQNPTTTVMTTNSSIEYNTKTANTDVGKSLRFILGCSLVLTNGIGIYIYYTHQKQ
jgi:hypothetical protein